MSCINGYARHVLDKEAARLDDICLCTRCGKIKYILDDGSAKWLDPEDADMRGLSDEDAVLESTDTHVEDDIELDTPTASAS